MNSGKGAIGKSQPGIPYTASGGDATYTYNSKKIHVFTNPGTLTVSGVDDMNLGEYVIIAGGGGGGYGTAGGGGGAGAYIAATGVLLPGTTPSPISIGAAGAAGATGGNTTALGITAKGGAGGGRPTAGGSTTGESSADPYGGSGGGGAGGGTSNEGTGGTYGNDGGMGKSPAWQGGGGGGGAGGAGSPAPSGEPGKGGLGAQLPTTFQDPTNPYGFPGPSGSFWFAGGGAGSFGNAPTGVAEGGGAPPTTGSSWAGAGGAVGSGSGDAASWIPFQQAIAPRYLEYLLNKEKEKGGDHWTAVATGSADLSGNVGNMNLMPGMGGQGIGPHLLGSMLETYGSIGDSTYSPEAYKMWNKLGEKMTEGGIGRRMTINRPSWRSGDHPDTVDHIIRRTNPAGDMIFQRPVFSRKGYYNQPPSWQMKGTKWHGPSAHPYSFDRIQSADYFKGAKRRTNPSLFGTYPLELRYTG